MVCRGICERFNARKHLTIHLLKLGFSKCNVCNCVLKSENNRCPCCGCMMQVKLRNRITKDKILEDKKGGADNI